MCHRFGPVYTLLLAMMMVRPFQFWIYGTLLHLEERRQTLESTTQQQHSQY